MILKEIEEKLKKVKLLAMDVDGTLTDGKVYYSNNGEELKKFSIRDGMGIELLHRNGIPSALVTSENSKIISRRAEKLKIEHLKLGSRNKKKDLFELAEKMSISFENIAYIGDDINDYYAVKVAGVSACPSDSCELIKNSVDYICLAAGGNGAVREFIELILNSQNKSVTLPETW